MSSELLYKRKGYSPPVHRHERVVGPGNITSKLATSKRYTRSTNSATNSPVKIHQPKPSLPTPDCPVKTIPFPPTSDLPFPPTSDSPVQGDWFSLVQELEILKGQLRKAELDKNEAVNKRVNAAAEKVLLSKQIQDLKSQLEDTRKTVGIQQGENNSLKISQKAQLGFQDDLNSVRAELAKTKKDLETYKKERDVQQGKIERLEQSLRDREIEYMELNIKLEQHEQNELPPSSGEKTKLTERISELERINTKLQAERSQITLNLQSLQKKIT